MRMPPNFAAQRGPGGHHASMEGGMRMPPNWAKTRCALASVGFNGGRHAHAAESWTRWQRRDRVADASMEGMRMSGYSTTHIGIIASMEGGMRMPPNREFQRDLATADRASMEGGIACRRIASMEGGMRMPPNRRPLGARRASMEGGMRMPPNRVPRAGPRFNGGRHAHAAESPL